MKTIIRKAKVKDAYDIARMMIQIGYPIEPTVMAECLLNFIDQEDSVAFVAEQEKRVVGCFAVHVLESLYAKGIAARIISFMVEESVRRQGIGTKIVQKIEEYAKMRGCKFVEFSPGRHHQRVSINKFEQEIGYAGNGRKMYLRKEI